MSPFNLIIFQLIFFCLTSFFDFRFAAANLKSKNEVKQKKINWNIIKLKGDTSLEFAQQLRKQNEFLEKKWNIEINKKSGNHTYKEPSVMVIYREDQEFNVNELIPTNKKSDNNFDLIIASQL